MKRFLINFSLIITALIIYFLQENFFNWFTIAGVMPNLFVILVLFIGLFTNKNKGTIYGLIIGMFCRKQAWNIYNNIRACWISGWNI